MEKHGGEKHVQISGSASLFYIVKGEQGKGGVGGPLMTPTLKARILMALVEAMDAHRHDPTMLRNGCLTICHFKIPQDVVRFMFQNQINEFTFSCNK
jgi:Zyg-11 family protein